MGRDCAYPDLVSATPSASPTIDGIPIEVGDEREVRVGKVAHGGHFVARLGDVVVFVRHALPGEMVRIRITEVRARFLRADAVEVLHSHAERRPALCPVAGECGGCDFQHAPESLQRSLKLDVLREALVHHGGLRDDRTNALLAEGVLDFGRETGWRTRMHYETTSLEPYGSTVALHRHRSEESIDARGCVIADPIGHQRAVEIAADLPVGSDVYMATGIDGAVVSSGRDAGAVSRHELAVAGGSITFTAPVDGFWQVHPDLVQALVDTVLEWGDPKSGETWWDLYSGVGPIAAALGSRVGASGRVHAVESSKNAVAHGRLALQHMPWVGFHRADVRTWVMKPNRPRPTGVVIDPPRSGAGAQVLTAVVQVAPQTLIIVACDPVALARDVGILADRGYQVQALRVWDAFPQTHHMETIALFRPVDRIS